ncbi:MAG: metal-dependent hydrolase [Magnetococcales bacterium]|nr:metal-dependent hydrolase [Magnetococcales bacterium]
MAAFGVHIGVAAVTGGVGVTTLMAAGLADSQTALLCFFTSLIGGVLPDVDADDSIPLNLALTCFALISSFFVMFSRVGTHSILESILLWLGTFLVVKLVIFEGFRRATTHRGLWHSLPAGVLCAGVTAWLSSHLFHLPPLSGWLAGLTLLAGFVVHLLLDELYSLNLLSAGGASHALGSAFKLHAGNLWVTGALYLAVVLILALTPGLTDMLHAVFNPTTVQEVRGRFLPTGNWFGLSFLPAFH